MQFHLLKNFQKTVKQLQSSYINKSREFVSVKTSLKGNLVESTSILSLKIKREIPLTVSFMGEYQSIRISLKGKFLICYQYRFQGSQKVYLLTEY